jgi:hypothetical protein
MGRQRRLARGLRPGAGVWLPLLISACGDPISNARLYEEARFLRALPSQSRFEAPSTVLLAPNGDAAVLASAKRAAATWSAWWAIATAGGDRLRETEADSDSELTRRWEAVEVATRKAGGPMGFTDEVLELWVQAEIVLVDGEEASWTMGVALSADGPWTGVGSGVDLDGEGEVTWDLSATSRSLGGEPPAPLGIATASYTDPWGRTDGLRSVEALVSPLPETAYTFSLLGDQWFTFVGQVAVTADGLEWPAQVSVLHQEEGGRAIGLVAVPEVSAGTTTTSTPALLEFRSCWDGSGTLVWQGGDEGIAESGTESGCPVADPF